MRFHPTFQQAGEHRLIYDGEQPQPQPPAAEAPQPQPEAPRGPEGADDPMAKLKIELQKDPEKAANALRELEINVAGQDARQMDETRQTAIDKAANAYFTALGGKPENLQQKVNPVFRAAVGISFVLEGGKLMRSPAGPENAQEKRLSPEEEKLVKDAINMLPENLRAVAERVAREMIGADPAIREVAKKSIEIVKQLPPEAIRHLLLHIFHEKTRGQPEQTTPEIENKINKAVESLGTEGQNFIKKLFGGVVDGVREEEKKASAEGHTDTLTPGDLTKLVEFMKDFDPSKVSETEKALKLAQLQMQGIDVSDENRIFDKGLPPEKRFQLFKGTNVERGFYQLMGFVLYLFASIQKVKEMVKPGGKKSTEVPAGSNRPPEAGAPSPEKEERRKKLREEMKAGAGKKGDDLRAEKQDKLKDTEKEVTRLKSVIEGIEQANKEQKDAGIPVEENQDLQEKKDIKKAEEGSAKLKAEIAELDAMKEEANKQVKEINDKRVECARLLAGLPPEAERTKQAFQAISFEAKPNDHYEITLAPLGMLPLAKAEQSLTAVHANRLAKPLPQSIRFDGTVLEKPEQLAKILSDLITSVSDEIKAKNAAPPAAAAPAPAPAPPAGPPAAPLPPAAPAPPPAPAPAP